MMPCCKWRKPLPLVATQSSMDSTVSSVSLRVLAAQTLKIASINGLGDTEKLDTELEDEIRWEETKVSAHETLGRLRKRCHNLLHGRRCLLIVVFLNIIDCCLVMGELVLDFRHVSNGFGTSQKLAQTTFGNMKSMYPTHMDDVRLDTEDIDGYIDELKIFFDHLLSGYFFFNPQNYTVANAVADCALFVNHNSSRDFPGAAGTGVNGSSVLQDIMNFAGTTIDGRPEHYNVLKIAHSLHYASITILSVLVFETSLKIACVGKRFLKKKFEMFDAFIIFVSFVLDLVFVEGITSLSMDKFFVIISFLLPWRVLRVVNSLVVAVSDQHMFNMKMLFKQKRKALGQLHESQEQNITLEKQVQLLKDLCTSKGIAEWEMNKALGQTLPANGGGGLKALSKLVFQAAESFAPLSRSSPRHGGLATASTTPDMASVQSSHAPSARLASAATAACNGDAELARLPRANGHAHGLHPAYSLGGRAPEDETVSVVGVEVEEYEPGSRSGSASGAEEDSEAPPAVVVEGAGWGLLADDGDRALLGAGRDDNPPPLLVPHHHHHRGDDDEGGRREGAGRSGGSSPPPSSPPLAARPRNDSVSSSSSATHPRFLPARLRIYLSDDSVELDLGEDSAPAADVDAAASAAEEGVGGGGRGSDSAARRSRTISLTSLPSENEETRL